MRPVVPSSGWFRRCWGTRLALIKSARFGSVASPGLSSTYQLSAVRLLHRFAVGGWCAMVCAAFPLDVFALSDTRYVDFNEVPGSMALVASEKTLPLRIDPKDYPGVLRATQDLQTDIERVTGLKPPLETTDGPPTENCVLVGTLGHSGLIDRLVAAGKVDVFAIRGRWEASLTQIVENPVPGVARALVIVGSDKRGTIFGIYDLSEQIGVSPWYWWADVPIPHRTALFVQRGPQIRDQPAVKYRGIFLNDEAPALTGWVTEKFGTYNRQFYSHVFELLLRLKANYLWPAMWNNAFNEDDPANPQLADEYGIVMGTSHHEPMLRAQQEWKRHGKGPWDYAKNDRALQDFWTEGIRRNRAYESIVTLGMRGDGDVPMSEESNVALLERIVADQRKILSENLNKAIGEVPQLWALYKEVQDYYERGMRVPDDVTLLWCDDNWGNLRRLPTAAERSRKGGAGVYYHFDYVGGPRSYKWINTVPITKVSEQMTLAWRYGADRIWIVNVGDLKPLEFPIEFFLTLAWSPEKWGPSRLAEYTKRWAEREFGPDHGSAVAEIVTGYTKHNGRRKPELLDPNTYSAVNYREAETVLADLRGWVSKAETIQASLPPAARDAFFELVLHPIKATALVNQLYAEAGLNRLFAVQGRASTNTTADRVRALFRADEELSRVYNEELGRGRWRHFMDQTHLGYTYWQQPSRNAMPAVTELQVPQAAEMGVAIEGSALAWPGHDPNQPPARLTPVDSVARSARYIEVFNRGREPFLFTASTEQPWLTVSPAAGKIVNDTRLAITIDWAAVPEGQREETILVRGANQEVAVHLPIFRVPAKPAAALVGYVETEGIISIEAEHYDRAVNSEGIVWETLPDHGRTLSGVTPYPVIAASRILSVASPRVEYDLILLDAKTAKVNLFFSPTLNFQPSRGMRCALSFDGDDAEILDLTPNSLKEWEGSVMDSIRRLTTKPRSLPAGRHVLKFWMIDPAVVLQKIVIDLGGLRPSYLGPPETVRLQNKP